MKNREKIPSRKRRNLLQLYPNGLVVIATGRPGRKIKGLPSGSLFLKKYYAWGFINIAKKPDYFSLYVTRPESRIEYFGKVKDVVRSTSADSPVSKIIEKRNNLPETWKDAENKKIILLKKESLVKISPFIKAGKAPMQGLVYTKLSKFAKAKNTDDFRRKQKTYKKDYLRNPVLLQTLFSNPLAKINEICLKLNLPEDVRRTARDLFTVSLKKRTAQDPPIYLLIPAVLFASSRKKEYPLSLHRLSEESGISYIKIWETYKKISSKLDVDKPSVNLSKSIKEYVRRFGGNLEIKKDILSESFQLIEEARKKRSFAGYDPKGVAAGVLYLSMVKNRKKYLKKT
ncbi:hypothetical protein AKJ61_03710 [candidate division MSBL1 archaeon SCGC-AAA259B11]|uniref:Transcription factor TFIIB cyclin-like domain-containing protein n=1 Tax=candidate division MSBL1 archaeon SCGC-AAA259B11 TaxID=1698260 RepID=A0A133U4D7_9EURY|nr:hypothetical protein AKJ61_03710 [candidate division MSBL1 archaeon SCGC-AAA259B11]